MHKWFKKSLRLVKVFTLLKYRYLQKDVLTKDYFAILKVDNKKEGYSPSLILSNQFLITFLVLF